jgi:N-acetylmuramoyl-L-alanine amidase
LLKMWRNNDEGLMIIVIHCSDSGFGNAVTIDSWHRSNGWSSIGYHFVILNGQISPKRHNSYFDGRVETGRPCDMDNLIDPDEVGAHTLGYNTKSIGICLIGLSGQFTQSQIRSLIDLLHHIKDQMKDITVLQHSDVDPVNRPYCAGLTKSQMQIFKTI